MAEIGLLQFAKVAREGAEAALPTYRSPSSKLTLPNGACSPSGASWLHALRGLDVSQG